MDGFARLQEIENLGRAEMAPFDLPAETARGGVDALLRLRRPARAVVGGDRRHPRDGAVLDERPHVLDPLVQTPVQPHRPRRIEQRADGVDQAGDARLGKRRISAEVPLVLALHHGDGQLAVVGRLEVQRVDAEVVPAVDDAVQRVLVGEVERRPGDEEQEGDSAFPVLVAAGPRFDAKGVPVHLDEAGHLLIDDLRRERRHPSSRFSTAAISASGKP